MANVLDDLAADIYKAADIVGRELVGFTPAVTVNNSVEEVALGQNVRSHFTRQASTKDISPSMTIPEGDDQTIDNKVLTLTRQRGVEIPWTGEDINFVNSGPGYETIYGDQITQAMRALVNEVETDLATEVYQNASRAVGEAGTTPFGSNFDVIAQGRQILADNGMPVNDNRTSLVMNTIAGTRLRNLAQLQRANEAGGDTLLRQGVLLDLQGVMMRESAQVQSHTAGTVTGDPTVTGANSIGATTINVTTGAGEAVDVSAGDIISFAGDDNEYVVAEAADIAADATGDVVIHSPGLRQATAGGEIVSAQGAYTGNAFVHQASTELAMRAPANPVGGDAAVDRMIVQDPHSGLVFEVSTYKGFKKAMILVGAVWGYKAWKPDAIGLLMG